MDHLEEKHIDTSRGMHYRYYISSASQADTTKPALLLCHGWPDSALLWKNIIPQLLNTKLRLIVPDLLGYGGSSKPTNPADLEIKAMITDVHEILQTEKITSKIITISHDWGAYFATRFYMLHKPLMAGLVTLNVAFMPPQTTPYDLDKNNAHMEKLIGYPSFAYWEVFADPEGPKLMEQNLESLWHALHGDADDWMKKLFCTRGAMKDWLSKGRTDVPLKPYAQDKAFFDEWKTQAIPGGLQSPCTWYRATKENHQFETEKTLDGRVTTPYLFIGCDGDAVCRTDFIEGSKKAGLVKEEDLEVHELKSGHWCTYEKPDEVAKVMVEWLRKKGFAG